MGSSFFGLNIATQGLYTANTMLNITSNNIANAETEGYSRQYGVVSATTAQQTTIGMLGTGVEVTEIKQYRSDYLDEKYQSMACDLGEYAIKNELLGQIELSFNEPSDYGFTSYLDDMFNSLETLSTDPTSSAAKTGFIDSASSLTSYFTNLADQLRDYQDDANFGVKTCVEQINDLASELAAVNNQITTLEINGGTANELRDERMNIIDELSEIISIETIETTDANGKETFKVTIDGQTLVDGNNANYLEVVARDAYNNVEDNPDLYDIYWASTGNELNLSDDSLSGQLKGYIDVRDGNNGEVFEGDILSGDGVNTIVVENVNDSDIKTTGEIEIDGITYNYTNAVYDEANNQMTFTLDTTTAPTTGEATIGDSNDYKGIPYYISELNEFVRTLAKEFNTVHALGEDGTGSELFTYDGYTGTPALDETSDYSYNAITIDNFCFSETIEDDITALLTSYEANPGESDNELILDLIELRNDVDMFDKGDVDSYLQALIAEIGVDAAQAENFETSQESLINLVENQRLSYSSVDLNEETANLVKYQQSYNLSAQMISVFEEIYDVTINGLIS
jgi:flagellar hook-associated protein 1 FlgK